MTQLRQFKDAKGNAHTIRFDYAAALRMSAAGFDIRDIRNAEGALSEIEADRFRFIEVLIACIQPTDVEEFRNSLMDGKVAGEAFDAFTEAVLDFFPRLRPILTALKARIAKMAEQVRQKIEQGEMDQLLQVLLTEQSGSTPASSASTPAPSA